MSRSTYHHGHLRDALVDAGSRLAARSGPDGVTVRAAAKTVGVTPTAAYRHFDGQAELLDAVKSAALARLANYVETAIAAVDDPDPSTAAVQRLRASGEAYVRFAVEQPGQFQVAFCQAAAPREARAFQLLEATLDELESLGRLTAESRPGAEYVAWAVVHGLAQLSLSGPLADLGPGERGALVDKALGVLVHGLAGS